jgi:class 3 adenylate cyclase
MQDAKAKKRREELRRAQQGPGDDDFLFDDNMEEQEKAESRVGKKLSDMTTRRVIILVLMMLFVLPYLEANSSSTMPFSSSYGVDQVHRSFIKYTESTVSDPPVSADLIGKYHKAYKDELLTFLYYHILERDFWTKVFWIGFGGERQKEMAAVASVDQSHTNSWTRINKNEDMGEIPSGAKKAISEPWNKDCIRRIGQSLIIEEEGVNCPEELRCQEVEIVSPTLINQDLKSGVFIAQFDKRPLIKQEAMLDTFKILFICVVLGAGSMMFAKDANMLVLNPLETMISKIEQIKDNPLIALKLGDDEFKREEIEKQKRKEKLARRRFGSLSAAKDIITSTPRHEPMETMILEKTIIKLGTLLALGFGEAGSKIIAQNMQGGDSATVNAMIPGHRIDCVLSYVSIRDFAVVNEVLQTHVMTFVNQIAEIVHGLADEYHGAANRSNGDSFLLVWRATEDMPDEAVQKLAEMSMLSVIRILSGIAQSDVLADYRGHPGLMQRVPNYRVSIGSSLHFGWTIEGAIGSEFKIDASYLSPNVNVAMKLEEATQTYGCLVLLSQNMVGLMSDPMIQACRVIDCVIVPGCKDPMRLLTCDLDTGILPIEPPLKTEGLVWNARRRFKARQVLEVQKTSKWSDDVIVHDLLSQAEVVKMMRSPYEERFLQIFGMAFHNYIAGEWEVALGMLSQTRMMLKAPDGPSVALMTFINSHKETKAPEGWSGYRELPQKDQQANARRQRSSILVQTTA